MCLVVGASAGSIGSGIAKSLAEAGFKKMVVVARTKSKLEETAKASKEAGAEEVLVLPKDLFLPGASEEVVKETVDHFGSKLLVASNYHFAQKTEVSFRAGCPCLCCWTGGVRNNSGLEDGGGRENYEVQLLCAPGDDKDGPASS